MGELAVGNYREGNGARLGYARQKNNMQSSNMQNMGDIGQLRIGTEKSKITTEARFDGNIGFAGLDARDALRRNQTELTSIFEAGGESSMIGSEKVGFDEETREVGFELKFGKHAGLTGSIIQNQVRNNEEKSRWENYAARAKIGFVDLMGAYDKKTDKRQWNVEIGGEIIRGLRGSVQYDNEKGWNGRLITKGWGGFYDAKRNEGYKDKFRMVPALADENFLWNYKNLNDPVMIDGIEGRFDLSEKKEGRLRISADLGLGLDLGVVRFGSVLSSNGNFSSVLKKGIFYMGWTGKTEASLESADENPSSIYGLKSPKNPNGMLFGGIQIK